MQLISEEYQRLNRELHNTNERYGRSGARWAEVAHHLCDAYRLGSVCDYGCGKGFMSPEMEVPCFDYDPAIEGKETPPEKVGLVMCTDVLEHIEPECIDDVLRHIHDMSDVAYLFIALRESNKWLSDGRNTHILVRPKVWWMDKLMEFWGRVEEYPLWGELKRYNKNPNKLSVLCRP